MAKSASGSFTMTITREVPVKKPQDAHLAEVLMEDVETEEVEYEIEVEYSVSGRYRHATREDPEEFPELEITSVTIAGAPEEFKTQGREDDDIYDKACEHSSDHARDYEAEKADYLYDQWKDEGRRR